MQYAKVIELLGKKKECNPYGALIHLKSAHGYNEMYFKAVKVVGGLLKEIEKLEKRVVIKTVTLPAKIVYVQKYGRCSK